MRVIFRGKHNIWRGWSAPRAQIVNDVAYVAEINHGDHFLWQVQYLVGLAGDFRCSVPCAGRFMRGGDPRTCHNACDRDFIYSR